MLRILLWFIAVGGGAHMLIGVVFAVLAMGTPSLTDKLYIASLSVGWGALAALAALGMLYWKVLRDALVEILAALGMLRK